MKDMFSIVRSTRKVLLLLLCLASFCFLFATQRAFAADSQPGAFDGPAELPRVRLYWLLDSEPVEVFAASFPSGMKDPIGQNNLVATLSFADGSVGSLTYCTVGSRTSGGERVEVFAPGVGAHAENFRESVVRSGVASKRSSWFAEKGYDAQMQAFFCSLRLGKPADITVRDGVRATIGCLRMLQSAREHAPCVLDLDQFLASPDAK